MNDHIKLAGLWDVKVGELAICVLDANTLALGSVENVRAAITAGKAGPDRIKHWQPWLRAIPISWRGSGECYPGTAG